MEEGKFEEASNFKDKIREKKREREFILFSNSNCW